MGIGGLRRAPRLRREKRACYDFFTSGQKGTWPEVSNEKKEIKVNDKRMFTSDGVLKEEYRFLDEKSTAPPAPSEPEPAAAPAAAAPFSPPPPERQPDAWPPERVGGVEHDAGGGGGAQEG